MSIQISKYERNIIDLIHLPTLNDIAKELGCSRKNVTFHLSKLYRKFNITTEKSKKKNLLISALMLHDIGFSQRYMNNLANSDEKVKAETATDEFKTAKYNLQALKKEDIVEIVLDDSLNKPIKVEMTVTAAGEFAEQLRRLGR